MFVALFAGHMVGDHLVQTHEIATQKTDPGLWGWLNMGLHLSGYGICQLAALGAVILLGAPITGLGLAVGMVCSLATHGFLDRRWPVEWFQRHTGSAGFIDPELHRSGINGMYLSDQAAHVACLFAAAFLTARLSVGAA